MSQTRSIGHAKIDCQDIQHKVIRCMQTKTHPTTHMGNYQRVQMSTLSTQQLLTHSIKGSPLEVMGLLLGNTREQDILVTRTFPLPVRSTETRVNAQAESYEYMVQYVNEMIESENEIVVGWYHSHPGYDCWLSNVDLRTQDLNQRFQDPYVAVVVDPDKSVKEGALSIGAFRTVGEEEDLKSVELLIVQFDSSLNNGLNNLALKYNFQCNKDCNEEITSNMLGKLYESMNQISNLRHSSRDNPLNVTVSSTNVSNARSNIEGDVYSVTNSKSPSYISLNSMSSSSSDIDSRPPTDIISAQNSSQVPGNRQLVHDIIMEQLNKDITKDINIDYANYQVLKQNLINYKNGRLHKLRKFKESFNLR